MVTLLWYGWFTNHALIDITSKIQGTCDKGIFACGVYVDFKKPLILIIMSFYLINWITME